MSNPYPGQPGDLPPTQVAPGGGAPPPQQPYPQQPGYSAPQTPYGATPGGGGGFPPPGGPSYPAPPTGGGGSKKVLLIVAIVVAALVLIGGGITAAILVLGDDDDSDDAKSKVTQTVTPSTDIPTTIDTSIPTEIPTTIDTSIPTTIDTSVPTTDAGAPTEDPAITSQAYLDSLVTGNCLAVQGLSTPEWFESEYGSQRGCKQASPQAEMSGASYDFEEPVDNRDGSVTLIAGVTAPDNTEFTATWTLVPSDDGTTWLVSFFLLI